MHVVLTGGAYRAHSLVSAAQRQVNLYSEPVPGNLTEPAPVALYPTPGLRALVTMAQAPIRGLHRATNGTLYVVAGSGVYAVSSAWTASSLLGSITGGPLTPVSMADNGLQLVIVDGSANGWTVTLANNAFARIVDPTGSFRGGTRVDYLDTFFLFAVPNTPQFQVSNSLATTFDPLYFANKEAFSDLLVSLIVAKREIWLIGTQTTEVWYNTGGADFPFSSMPGVFIDRGCCAPYSVAEIDNAVFWLSQDRYGQGIILQGAGYEATRVSTYAIEAELATYASLTDAIGYTYQLAGHVYYVLSFPSADKTWCYDITTKLWHEWVWLDTNGTEHRHRGVCGCAAYSTVVLGDWQSGALYALDPAVYTDAGRPIMRLRAFPHLEADGKRVFFRQFLADMEAGNEPAATTSIIVPGTIPDSRQIARLVVPVDAFGTPTTAVIDWDRGRVFLWQQSPAAMRVYTTAVATQSPSLSATLGSSTFILGADVDPVSGSLITQDYSGLTNGMPIHKYDATSLALLGTFGVSTSFPSYPTSIWAGQALVCISVSGVGYALVKQSVALGVVSVIRTDTMTAAGFSAAVVSGATLNRAIMCKGASGGTRGSVFLTWQGSVNGNTATIPLYTVVITAAAAAYNIAAWPTANAGITSSTVGSIAAASVDPTWTTLQANTIGYDGTDGNVLIDVTTTNSVTNTHYIIKVNATSAAVMWAVAIGNTGNATVLSGYNVGYGYAAFLPSALRDVITTGAEALNSAAMAGLTMTNGFAAGDDVSGLMVLKTIYAAGGTAPTAVSGTPSSFTGWAVLAGVYPSAPTSIPVSALDPQIYLSWSDDGGRHFGNPVGISMGRAGAYLTSLQWQRLGMGRRRVFQLEWSVPVRTALLGAWIDSTPAQS